MRIACPNLKIDKTYQMPEQLILSIQPLDWQLLVPIMWSDTIWNYCSYDWDIYVNEEYVWNFTWTWSSNNKYIVIKDDCQNVAYQVTIKPHTQGFWRARAFAYWHYKKWSSAELDSFTDSWIWMTLEEIIEDRVYFWFTERSNSYKFDYFRACQYYRCVNLLYPAEEFIYNKDYSNNSSWNFSLSFFRLAQYSGCTSLRKAADECLPKNAFGYYYSDYFRAYQYDWCTNLVDVPPEVFLLNWQLRLYFRLCQYRNCVSLKKPAEEDMNNSYVIYTVWDCFREKQYYWAQFQIWEANWVTPKYSWAVTKYRNLQFEWTNLTKLNIEWTSIEPWNWSIPNNTLVTVPDDLLESYKNSPDWRPRFPLTPEDIEKEKIVIKLLVVDRNPFYYVNCPISWNMEIEVSDINWTVLDISDLNNWTWSKNFSKWEYIYVPQLWEIIMTIRPVTIVEWRADTFTYSNIQNYAGQLSYIIYDNSHFWYTVGTNYRASQFKNCVNLTNISTWGISSFVTEIPQRFREQQYAWCTSLTNDSLLLSEWDIDDFSWVTKVNDYFMYKQFMWCSNLKCWLKELYINCAIWNTIDFRTQQYDWCTNLDTAYLTNPYRFPSSWSYYRNNQYINCWTNNPITMYIAWTQVEQPRNTMWLTDWTVEVIYVDSSVVQRYRNADRRSAIDDNKFQPMQV